MTPKTRISIDVNYDESPVLFKNNIYKFTETLKGIVISKSGRLFKFCRRIVRVENLETNCFTICSPFNSSLSSCWLSDHISFASQAN